MITFFIQCHTYRTAVFLVTHHRLEDNGNVLSPESTKSLLPRLPLLRARAVLFRELHRPGVLGPARLALSGGCPRQGAPRSPPPPPGPLNLALSVQYDNDTVIPSIIRVGLLRGGGLRYCIRFCRLSVTAVTVTTRESLLE